jgi:hypothetical protein
MKKMMIYAAKAAAVVAVAAIYFHFEVGDEITDFVKTVATKIVPWANTVIYS